MEVVSSKKNKKITKITSTLKPRDTKFYQAFNDFQKTLVMTLVGKIYRNLSKIGNLKQELRLQKNTLMKAKYAMLSKVGTSRKKLDIVFKSPKKFLPYKE